MVKAWKIFLDKKIFFCVLYWWKIRHEDTKLWWEIYIFFASVLQLIDNDKDDDYDDDKKSVAVRYRITKLVVTKGFLLSWAKKILKNFFFWIDES